MQPRKEQYQEMAYGKRFSVLVVDAYPPRGSIYFLAAALMFLQFFQHTTVLHSNSTILVLLLSCLQYCCSYSCHG